jgi:hypothetical protein
MGCPADTEPPRPIPAGTSAVVVPPDHPLYRAASPSQSLIVTAPGPTITSIEPR